MSGGLGLDSIVKLCLSLQSQFVPKSFYVSYTPFNEEFQ